MNRLDLLALSFHLLVLQIHNASKASRSVSMVRERTPARGGPKSQLGDSYVIDSDGDDEYTPPPAAARARQPDRGEPPETPRKRVPPSRGRASAEPEFIMPSIHESSIGNSWLGKERRRAERSPEKRSRKTQKGRSNQSRESIRQDSVADAIERITGFFTPILSWLYDVLGGALQTLRTPISYFLAGSWSHPFPIYCC